MRLTPRPRDGLPLTAWAGGGAVGTGALVLAVVTAGFALSARLDRVAAALLIAGAAVTLCCGGLAVAGVRRLVHGLCELDREALRRLSDPAAAPGPRAIGPHRELRELARTLDALQLRVRVSDEIAERHRRTAQTASAGMFELLAGLVAAEEGARGQLAAELHDTVAQTLMTAHSLLSVKPIELDELRRAAELVAEAEEQVRAVMARTRPPALRDGDLAVAVTSLRDDMLHRYGLEVHLEWPRQPRPLPLATAITTYRFFQEALLNVVKHADVDEAMAALRVEDEELWAVVRDHGPGFDPERVRPERGRHVGLGLLRERARLAGGSLEVSSWPGNGTTLTLRLPVVTAVALVTLSAA